MSSLSTTESFSPSLIPFFGWSNSLGSGSEGLSLGSGWCQRGIWHLPCVGLNWEHGLLISGCFVCFQRAFVCPFSPCMPCTVGRWVTCTCHRTLVGGLPHWLCLVGHKAWPWWGCCNWLKFLWSGWHLWPGFYILWRIPSVLPCRCQAFLLGVFLLLSFGGWHPWKLHLTCLVRISKYLEQRYQSHFSLWKRLFAHVLAVPSVM